jgi:hypothetical protein
MFLIPVPDFKPPEQSGKKKGKENALSEEEPEIDNLNFDLHHFHRSVNERESENQ